MKTSGLLQCSCEALQASLTLQETGYVHDSMNSLKEMLIYDCAVCMLCSDFISTLIEDTQIY